MAEGIMLMGCTPCVEQGVQNSPRLPMDDAKGHVESKHADILRGDPGEAIKYLHFAGFHILRK